MQLRDDSRRRLVETICSEQLTEDYDLELQLDVVLREELIEEPRGDALDAVLCAIQAGWAYGRRESRYGIPECADAVEGWIVDPATEGVTA